MCNEIELQRLRNALKFYANSDNYWSAPLPLDTPYDRQALKAVRAAEKDNKILSDRGKIAQDALATQQEDKEKGHESEMMRKLFVYFAES